MVKLPPGVERKPGDENYSQLLHDFGILITQWQTFELAIEIKIARLTGMKFLHASIVLGTMGAGMKQNVLYSLLKESGEDHARKSVKELIQFAKRNALVHGMLAPEEDYSSFDFFNREVKDEYVTKRQRYSADEFHARLDQILDLILIAMNAMGVSEDDLNEYGREARFVGID